MAKALLSITLLATAALAAPRPDVEVVQVRQIEKRQASPSDIAALLPSDLDLNSILAEVGTALPSDFAIPSDLDVSSIINDIATAIPSGCMPPSELLSVPTPPPDVESALLKYTDACKAPSFTGDVGKHYTSYLSEASAWQSSNSPVILSYFSGLSSACPYASELGLPTDSADLSSYVASLTASLPLCESGASKTGAAGAKETGSGTTAGSKETGSNTAQPTNNTGAAPQQTAFAAVAGVVAGFAGVVAYL